MEVQPSAPPAGTPAAVEALAGKYMAFQLAQEVFGLPILEVREIIGLMEITRVPLGPGFIKGVINLRGRVIPVVDLRARFGMPPTATTEQTVVIVVQVQVAGRALTMGLLVDLVLEVLDVPASAIEPPPDLGQGSIDGDFILGVGKSGHRVVFLLDVGRVLGGDGLKAAAQATHPT